jgi:hypothetical protein
VTAQFTHAAHSASRAEHGSFAFVWLTIRDSFEVQITIAMCIPHRVERSLSYVFVTPRASLHKPFGTGRTVALPFIVCAVCSL